MTNLAASDTARLSTAAHVMRAAACAGLCAGFVEAVGFLVMQAAGRPARVPIGILWIAPAFDLLLFLAAGIAVALATRIRRIAPIVRRHGAVIPLWMLAFDLALLPGVMSPPAALLLGLGLAIAVNRLAPSIDQWGALASRWLPRVSAVVLAGAVAGLVWPRLEESRKLRALGPSPAGTPNVLLVTLDTLRADHVSAYGYSRDTTPNLAGFAARGVLFEHAIANSSWTLPSHASMLTGTLPHEHGADWLDPMRDTIPTLPEAFAGRGYVTAAFAANASYVAPEWGLGRGFTRFSVYGSSLADDAVRTVFGRRLALTLLPRLGFFDIPGRKRAADVNDEFFSWVSRRGDRPFFALLNFLDVHDPYLTEHAYHSRYSKSPARGDLINFQFQPHAFRRKPALSADEIQAEVDAYDGCLAYLDAQLGALLSGLASRGLDRNTLVIVTSDHGESFGNHDLFGHGNSLYFETLHVPLIVSWPGHVPGGVRVTQVVGLDRLPATIASLAWPGVPEPSRFPARTLSSLWNGDTPTAEPVVSEVSHVEDGPVAYPSTGGALTSLMTDDWHLIASTGAPSALYAWKRDPEERQDLAGTPEGQTVVSELTRLLASVKDRSHTAPVP